MITLSIVGGDLLEAKADAILLPIDGVLPSGAGAALIERGLGRIARAFARRHSSCDLVEEIESQASFPLALGDAAAVELPPGSPFRHALLLSSLAHGEGQTGEAALRGAASGAFAQALRLCDVLGIQSVAAPLLKGGWRISTPIAMTTMLAVIGSVQLQRRLELTVFILDDPPSVVAMRDLAHSLGLLDSPS